MSYIVANQCDNPIIVRDNFDSPKAEWETRAAETLGAPVTIKFDANAVLAYADNLNYNAGSTLARQVVEFLTD